jgi:CheY-like chemotaxis protein
MKPVRILIVEDDLLIAMLLQDIVISLGYSVCGIESRESNAVAAALYHRPDLIMTDARLAEGNGISAVNTIRQTFAVPCIITSGSSLDAELDNAVMLKKPFRKSDIVMAVSRLLHADETVTASHG